MQAARIRIGTRGSPLAVAQAREVEARLEAAHGASHGAGKLAFEVRIIKTTGDRIQDRPLAEAGGKGLFTKEIEEALLAREVDIAVHYLQNPERAAAFGERLTARLSKVRHLYTCEVGAAVAAHVGPGLLGVVVSRV